ncbi:hypothetical protein [Mesorhizobium sp.]|uniref:hypothetical protein n=1 Tax=Mesorhizobium sp. TaxID=1871066 RepID=UPI0025F5B385|nr:hypothetical protein [Mesorhizobium sp.]
MCAKVAGPLIVGTIVGVATIVVYAEAPGFHVGVCSTDTAVDQFQKTVEFLDSIIQLGITLSTGLIGLGAALLLGLQGNLRPTPWSIAVLSGSMLCLAQTVLYGIWWKSGIANLWFNSCWEKIDADFLQYRYSASFEFFMGGILLIGVLVVSVAWQRIWEARA